MVSLETYLRELADPQRPLTVSKLATLSGLGPDDTSLFIDTWHGLDERRRRRIVQELIELAEDTVELDFDSVFTVALADADPAVRIDAIRGLWEHEGRDLIEPLAGLLESDPEPSVRAEAALALGRYVLHAELDALREPAAERVEQALRRAVDDITELAEVRGRALEALGARSEPWVEELIRCAFEDGEPRLRLSAVHAMGRSCDPAWLPGLYDELMVEDAELRFEAAGALGAIADEAATPHLLPLLDDDDEEVQEAAIGALGQIGGEEAKEALRELVAGRDERVREAALAALAEIDLADDPLGFKLGG